MSEDVAVTNELCKMLTKKLKRDVKEDALDEIVLSYVAGIVDDLTLSACPDQEEVDVEALVELLSAYLPGAENIPEEEIGNWLVSVATKVKEARKKESKSSFDLSSAIRLPCAAAKKDVDEGKKQRQRSTSSSSSNDAQLDSKANGMRISRMSENSDGGSDGGSFEIDDFQQTVTSLLEMFPYSCALEVTHCLQLMAGDVEQTTQLIMDRHENGQDLKPTDRKIKVNKVTNDDKDVKERILGKYGFVDQEDDKIYHRPTVKKSDDKKMLRYRDGKIVSTKGERFTQVSKAESEEMKKSIKI
jgi:hypothetical protein